jgi:protein SCO1/2
MSESQHLRQQRGIKKTILIIFAVIAVFFAGFLHKVMSPRVLSPQELSLNGAIAFENPRIINDFSLHDHNGKAFTLKQLQGQWTLIYFGFTSCPDVCPTTLAQLNRVVEKLGADAAKQVQVVMVTVDPARDTDAVLKPYVSYFNPNFVGVTGEFLELMKLTRNLNVAFNKVVTGDSYTIDHTGNLIVVNPRGHYHGFLKPPFELARVKLTLKSMIAEYY